MAASNSATLLSLAEQVLDETYSLVKRMKRASIEEPSLEVGSKSDLWLSPITYLSDQRNELEEGKRTIFGLTKQLTNLLNGPHEVLHEYVSSNWDHGALYALLEFDILGKIPLDGCAHVSDLAKQAGLPENKLLCILRLSACDSIVKEVSDRIFAHTAISEELLKDPEFKAFIGFQLFETRVASAHLADTLKKSPNEYWSGLTAFQYAWGKPMYDWQAAHQEKAARFRLAMRGVSQSGLDPARALFHEWFSKNNGSDHVCNTVIELGSDDGQISVFLAGSFPLLSFRVQVTSSSALQFQVSLPSLLADRISSEAHNILDLQQVPRGIDRESGLVYTIYNMLWNMSDEECVKVLQTLVPVFESHPRTVLLVNELVSPEPGTFKPHDEKIFRRRDVTLTTMHNVKQRTEQEWTALVQRASPFYMIHCFTAYTCHSCRCLLEIEWEQESR